MTKEIELDVYSTKITVSQAIEKGKEFTEAIDIAHMINMLIFKQTDNKTSKQITFILGDIRRFCAALEHEILEQRREESKKDDTS